MAVRRAAVSRAQTEAALAAGVSERVQGIVVSQDWINGLVRVNVGGGEIPATFSGPMPVPGFRAWVAFLSPTQPHVVGQIQGPSSGVVVGAATGGRVNVLGDDGTTYKLGYLGSAPADTSRVLIDWTKGGLILGGAVSVLPGDTLANPVLSAPPPPPPTPQRVERTFTWNPSTSRNWYLGAWSSHAGNEVWCSDNNEGCYFYGNAIPDAIPDDAEFVSGSLAIYLDEFYNQYPSSLARLGQHNKTDPSGGGPGFANDILVSAGSGWKQLPDSWEDEFRLGSARGVGFDAPAGYHKFRPAGVNNSGAISGKWRVWA